MNKINSNFEGQTIFVGMDIHKSSWNLGIHLNDMFVKNVHQKPNPSIMANYLKQHYPGKALDCKQKSRRRALDYMISQMEYLRKELLTISNEIRKMMREQRYKTNYYLLRTIPGIGPLTAASILVEIGDVKRFETFYHLNSL